MKKIYGYIAAAVIAGSLIISTAALAQTNDISAELEYGQARAAAISELNCDHVEKSLERIRKIGSRHLPLERSTAGRIHWYVLKEPSLAGQQ